MSHRVPHIPASRLFRINSRFKRATQTNSDFTYSFENRLVDGCYMVALVSASIPRLYTNIFNANNTLEYRDELTGVVKRFSVPNGQYTATELADALNQCEEFIITYDDVLHRFIFNSPSPYTLMSSSTIGHYIGLTSSEYIQNSVALEAPPSLAGCQTIYLQSQFLACANTVDTPAVSPFIPLVVPISASAVPYGYTVSFTASDLEVSRIAWGGKVSLRQIDIQLTDQYGNPLNFPDNAYCDLVFRMYYED